MEKQEIRYRVTMKAYHQAAIYGLIMRNRLLFRMGILAVLAVAGYVVFALRGMVEMSFLPVYIAVAYLIWMLVLLGREEQNIYRYAKSIGCDIPSFNDEIDLTGVSDWARDGYSYAMTVGLAKGYDGEFAPTSPASRALVAVMFANFAELLK